MYSVEPVGIFIGERTQDDGIDDAEDRGRGADAEREREYHGRREAWASPQPTPRVPDVPGHLLQEPCTPDLVAFLLEPEHAAETRPGGAIRLRLAHACLHVLPPDRFEVERHLLIHVAVAGAGRESRDESAKEAAWTQSHLTLPVRWREAPV